MHACEAISGYFVVLTRNCPAPTLDYIVMQMRKTNREKGYYLTLHSMNTHNNYTRQIDYKFREIDNTTHNRHDADTSIRF